MTHWVTGKTTMRNSTPPTALLKITILPTAMTSTATAPKKLIRRQVKLSAMATIAWIS